MSVEQEEEFQKQIVLVIELAYRNGLSDTDVAGVLMGVAVSRCIESGATKNDVHILVEEVFKASSS